MSPEQLDAAEALEIVRQSRRRMVPKTRAPVRALHVVFAAILSGFVAAYAAPLPVDLLLDVVLVVAIFAMVRSLRLRYGVSVNGWRRPGLGRVVTMGVTAVYLAFYLASAWAKLRLGLWWAPLAGAALLFPLALAGYVWWSRIYRAELERGL